MESHGVESHGGRWGVGGGWTVVDGEPSVSLLTVVIYKGRHRGG